MWVNYSLTFRSKNHILCSALWHWGWDFINLFPKLSVLFASYKFWPIGGIRGRLEGGRREDRNSFLSSCSCQAHSNNSFFPASRYFQHLRKNPQYLLKGTTSNRALAAPQISEHKLFLFLFPALGVAIL